MNHYHQIADSLSFVAENFKQQPSLAELAARANMSEYHFQRVFSDWAGVSPKKFLQYVTLEYARRCLDESVSVLETSHAAGLSGPSRLHDLFVTADGLSPGEYKAGGENLTIEYGYHETQFGQILILLSPRGVTALSFVDDEPEALLERLKLRLPNALYCENQQSTVEVTDQIFMRRDASKTSRKVVRLLLAGTPFQLKVWQALLTIPEGACATYSQLATQIGNAKAQRAVGTAIGANPIACLIPCHRVIRQNGLVGGYRWGEGRKLALLGSERIRKASGFNEQL